MAGVRSQFSFHGKFGDLFRLDIYDPNFVGSTHVFEGDNGFTLRYESEDDLNPFADTIISSKVNFSVYVNSDADFTEVQYLIENQFEDFVVEIYKNGSIFWRGLLQVDGAKEQNMSRPYSITFQAFDGLKSLEIFDGSGNFGFQNTIAEGFVNILSQTGVFANTGASDTVLKTANRWYENSMSATGTGTDPLTLTRFASALLLFETSNIDGDKLYYNALRILQEFLKVFKCKLFMCEGVYHIIQTDQLAEGVLYLHSYPKNYPTGSKSVTSFDPDVVATIGGRGVFSFTPVVGRATANQNIKQGGTVFNLVQRDDWNTPYALGTVTNFSNTAQLNLEFISGPVAWWEYTGSLSSLALRALQAEFEIKLDIANTHFLTNKNGGLQWTTNSADRVTIRVNNVSVLARSTTTITADASPFIGGQNSSILTLPVLPAGGTLTLEIEPKLIDPTGSSVTASLALGDVYTGVKLYYVDPTIVEGDIEYRINNQDTESGYIFEGGEYLLSDFIQANYTGALSVYNGSTWVYSSNWKREAVGTAYPIIELGLRQVVEWCDKPLQIIEGDVINSPINALSRIERYGKKYVLQRASFDPKADQWSGSWVEFQTANSGPAIGLEEPVDNRGGVAQSGKYGRANNIYLDRIEQAALKLTTTSADHTGTITTVNIVATNFDIDATQAEIVIVNPVNGKSDVLDLNADWLQGTTSLSVSSKALSVDYPKGSAIYMSLGQILQRVYNLENP